MADVRRVSLALDRTAQVAVGERSASGGMPSRDAPRRGPGAAGPWVPTLRRRIGDLLPGAASARTTSSSARAASSVPYRSLSAGVMPGHVTDHSPVVRSAIGAHRQGRWDRGTLSIRSATTCSPVTTCTSPTPITATRTFATRSGSSSRLPARCGSAPGRGWVTARSCSRVRHRRNVAVGAGSVVTGHLPVFSVAVGNPARVIRQFVEGRRRVRVETSAHDHGSHDHGAGSGRRSPRGRRIAQRLVLGRQHVEHRPTTPSSNSPTFAVGHGRGGTAFRVGVAVEAAPSRRPRRTRRAGSHQITVASSPPVRSTPFQMPCLPHDRCTASARSSRRAGSGRGLPRTSSRSGSPRRGARR